MRAVIVFHSVCGNCYLVAGKFNDELKARGVDVAMYRVADPFWVEKPDLSLKARGNVRAMRELPEAVPEVLVDADIIIMGSPTYFGNVSAQMKAFMDATGGLWVKARLAGKKFVAFSSAGNTEGGGDLCLQALHTYAKYMGMLSVPVPVTAVPGENICILGIVHYSGGKYAEVPDPRTERIAASFCDILAGPVKI